MNRPCFPRLPLGSTESEPKDVIQATGLSKLHPSEADPETRIWTRTVLADGAAAAAGGSFCLAVSPCRRSTR